MLCYLFVLSSVFRSAALRLRRAALCSAALLYCICALSSGPRAQESCSMLCCTSVLSSVLRSVALGLRRAVAVPQICALFPG